jgi:hypothetical protein
MNALALLLLAMLLPPTPLVFESVDEIAVVQVGDSSFARVVFIRDGQAFADRMHSVDMHVSHNGQRFVLQFDDYCHGRVERIIEADRYSFTRLPEVIDADGQSRDWWAMDKRMTDLKRPD